MRKCFPETSYQSLQMNASPAQQYQHIVRPQSTTTLEILIHPSKTRLSITDLNEILNIEDRSGVWDV